jgi:isopenicillin N synthase-like dioxygenase
MARRLQQWPDEDLLPGFKDILERYLVQVEELSLKFINLLSEAFGLLSNELDGFYDSKNLMQHRAKVFSCINIRESLRIDPAFFIDRSIPRAGRLVRSRCWSPL